MNEDEIIRVASVLKSNGFQYEPGLARKIFEESRDFSEPEIVDLAIEKGAVRLHAKKIGDAKSIETSMNLILAHMIEKAKNDIVHYFSSDEIMDSLINYIIDEAVDGYMEIFPESLYMNKSGIGEKYIQYDLSSYSSVGDFIDGSSDEGEWHRILHDESRNTETLRSKMDSWIINKAGSVISAIITEALFDIGDETKELLSEATGGIYDYLLEEIYDEAISNISEEDVYDELYDYPFKEAILKYRPDARGRLKKDEARSRIRKQIESNVDENEHAYLKEYLENVHKIIKMSKFDLVLPIVLNETTKYRKDVKGVFITKMLLDEICSEDILNNEDDFDFLHIADDYTNLMRYDSFNETTMLSKLFDLLNSDMIENGSPWSITIHSDNGFFKFDRSNWFAFSVFSYCKKFSDDFIVVVLRKFETNDTYADLTGVDQSISALRLYDDTVEFLSSEEVMDCYRMEMKGESVYDEKDLSFESLCNQIPSSYSHFQNVLHKNSNAFKPVVIAGGLS